MMLLRHGPPGKHDAFPYGTSCKSISASNQEFDIYIQTSAIESSPRWELIGNFNVDTDITILEEEISKRLKN